MSAIQSLFAVALLLGMAVASATPTAAQDCTHGCGPGIRVTTSYFTAWTLTVITGEAL